MKCELPTGDGPLDPTWLQPLEIVAAIVADDPDWHLFDPADLMVMTRLVRRPRPDLVLYKHTYTRGATPPEDAPR